mmetsp:Transcript_12023/g.32386  ORF Transcript_12023/g.32386 Transcript_12023/m.32386 type:complete len:107 (+) Transcript_12023:78-398(+)|eukprot:CAMPEP_0185829642 /NCGR_PEP_ID=MMETSP1353-20130828/373_1 /TAXON_ID=1077150 /ORGANISM="Erythrolobus australicus, Strain CCMP3124" /LENGTH=106 /DNA_ID=CAMNT_0028527459 /DNA_START=78 /DNA_END=398 /DNA_ORIENTATION=+
MAKLIQTAEQWDELMKQSSEQLVFVDFFATWCGPCRMMEPVIEELVAEYSDVVFAKIDADVMGEVFSRQNVSAMPTFGLYKAGKKIDEKLGACPKTVLDDFIRKNK